MGPTRPHPLTLTDVDRALNAARTAFLHAEEHGDLDGANLAYTVLDQLLDSRLALPRSA